MNYLKYYPIDVVNGPGTRCTLFVSGCEHNCRGCYNQTAFDPKSGFLFDEEMSQQIIDDLKSQTIKRRGLSLSGGDPLYPSNINGILKLIKRVKAECPEKDIWLWSGYKVEDLSLKQQAVINLVDMFVDGPFIKALADPKLLWRGSSNQRFIDFQSTGKSCLLKASP